MFEISQLKAKKLPELQEIANQLKVPKFKTLKKMDLVYQILDLQAANPQAVKAAAPEVKTTSNTEPKRRPNPRPRKERVQSIKSNPQALNNLIKEVGAEKAPIVLNKVNSFQSDPNDPIEAIVQKQIIDNPKYIGQESELREELKEQYESQIVHLKEEIGLTQKT